MAENEDIADSIVRRQIAAERRAAGLWQELLPILRSAERELVRHLDGRDVTAFSSRRTQTMLREIRELIEGGITEFGERLSEELTLAVRAEANAQVRSFRRVVGGAEWARPSAALLGGIASTTSFRGLSSQGMASLDDWLGRLSSNTVEAIEDIVREGIAIGQTNEDMVRRIVGTRANGFKDGVLERKYRTAARTLVRTSASHVTNQARSEVYKANSDVILREVWIATLDSRTSVLCMGLSQTHGPGTEGFPIGEGLYPPAHPNCRSVRVPETRFSAQLQRESSQEWLRRQSEDVQLDVLGRRRWELWRNGASLDRFITDDRRTLTLEEFANAA